MSHKALPTFRVSNDTCIVQAQVPPRPRVTPASPVLSVLTDLTEVRAATAQPLVTLADAERAMIQQRVRMLGAPLPAVEVASTFAEIQRALR
jgi:hypothetical protein